MTFCFENQRGLLRGVSPLLLVIHWLILATLAVAHDGPHPHSHKVADEEIHKPTAIPARILLSWEGDPTSSAAVTWRTSAEVVQGSAEIAIATDGPGFPATATKVSAVTTPLETDSGLAHCHTVSFTALTPKTKYVYRVGDGENWSEWFQFQTASTEPEHATEEIADALPVKRVHEQRHRTAEGVQRDCLAIRPIGHQPADLGRGRV